MKKIVIEIESELTPMHTNIMLQTMCAALQGLEMFWKGRSKKKFNITVGGSSLTDYQKNNNL